MSNHDFPHCSGRDFMGTTNAPVICEKRNECHRYSAFQELINHGSERKFVPIMDPAACMNNGHDQFMEKTKGSDE